MLDLLISYHVLTKRMSQGEQIALLCKTLKASVLYTERQGYQSAGDFHCCDKRRRRRKEELGEGILPGQPIQRTPPPALPLYSFEWGTPLHFSSVPSGVCVKTELESVCEKCSGCVDMS